MRKNSAEKIVSSENSENRPEDESVWQLDILFLMSTLFVSLPYEPVFV